jgi:hypothetical protein
VRAHPQDVLAQLADMKGHSVGHERTFSWALSLKEVGNCKDALTDTDK